MVSLNIKSQEYLHDEHFYLQILLSGLPSPCLEMV